MKKYAIALAAFISVASNAQQSNNGTLEQVKGADRSYIGLKGGVNMSTIHLNNASYNSSPLTNGMAGIFYEYRFGKTQRFALRPELSIMSRGGKLSSAIMNYQLSAQYLDLRIAAIYAFTHGKALRPYIYIAPNVGTPYRGSISYNGEAIDASTYNLAPIHVGILGGVGLSYAIESKGKKILEIGVEAGYNWGVTNTYSQKELNGQSTILNPNGMAIEGTRTFRGIETNLTVSVPLSVFRRKKRVKIVEAPAPIPIAAPVAPVVEEPVEVVPVVIPPAPVVEKDCYSFDEITEMIAQNQDVSGKRICALEGAIKFDTDKATFDKKSELYIDQIVMLMNNMPKMQIAISGHTDNVGLADYNLDLSNRRARAVYNYMIEKGIDKSRLTSTGFGLTRPVNSNDIESGRANNRRVEFEINYINQ